MLLAAVCGVFCLPPRAVRNLGVAAGGQEECLGLPVHGPGGRGCGHGGCRAAV